MLSRTLVALYISLYISIKPVWEIIFEYSRSYLCIDLTVSHFHFVPINVVLMGNIPQTGCVLIQAVYFQFLSFFSFSMSCLWLFYFDFEVNHCCTLTIVRNHCQDCLTYCLIAFFAGKHVSEAKLNFCPGSKHFFELRQKRFLVCKQKNLPPQHRFLV